MSGDKQRALRYLRFARDTHCDWRDWLRLHPDDPRAKVVGSAEEHATDVEEYENVLEVMKGCPG